MWFTFCLSKHARLLLCCQSYILRSWQNTNLLHLFNTTWEPEGNSFSPYTSYSRTVPGSPLCFVCHSPCSIQNDLLKTNNQIMCPSPPPLQMLSIGLAVKPKSFARPNSCLHLSAHPMPLLPRLLSVPDIY